MEESAPKAKSPKLIARLRQQYRVAALCMAMGMQMEEAASHCNCAVEDLARWIRDDRFQDILREFNEDIETQVIERVVRKRVRATARLQCAVDDAAIRVLDLMHNAKSETVVLNAAKGVLRQGGIDLDRLYLGDQVDDPVAVIEKEDPQFFNRHEEAMKELEGGKGK
jgi:hypothetical protein